MWVLDIESKSSRRAANVFIPSHLSDPTVLILKKKKLKNLSLTFATLPKNRSIYELLTVKSLSIYPKRNVSTLLKRQRKLVCLTIMCQTNF